MQVSNNKQVVSVEQSQQKQSPSFKSGFTSPLIASGNIMQSVENGGFLASFLIQDCAGMTLPRTVAGFLRDKEVTGKYNTQEGFEVFGREGLTGPCMMAVAPLMFLAAAKFGRSTSVNTQLIKRFGKNLEEFIARPNFDKSLLKTPSEFKQKFYRANIEKMLENTVGKENVTSEKVEYILKQVNNYEKIPADAKLERFRGKAKYRNKCMNNITEAISSLKYETSSDLDMLQKVKLGEDKKTFPTQRAFDAMIKYSDDAITANKRINELDALQAENIKNRAIAKRVITNISTMFATLGVLSVLPKIYARSDTAPGARKMTDEERGFKEVSFKGGKKGNDVLAKMGKKISESKKYDKAASELEYNGHNFTNTLMAGLSLFGLLAPRGLRAYRRAQVDNDTGKKDMTELWEIGLRDVTSSLAVVFAVPMLTRASVTAYEKQSGFVLMHKDRSKSKLATVLDLFNPYSKAHVLKNSEITALYDGIDSQAKMLNFCKYIDKNGGDLQKIISKSENIEEVFNEKTLKLSALKGDKSAKNKEIISFFEKNSGLDNSIKKLMSKVGKGKGNKIATIARGLNSVPGVLTTFFISPYILGWVIPRLTYANTRRIHEKQDRERAEKLSTNA